jgi:hypothetical protein
MSELEIQHAIAGTTAQTPATGQNGPIIGAVNAIAIMKALKDSGYVIMPRDKATVWIYVNTSKQVGDVDHFKVFATEDAAHEWLERHDDEGVAFAYPVIGEN